MWLSKRRYKYVVYNDDGYVLIITRYKNIANTIIKEYKYAKEKRKDSLNS